MARAKRTASPCAHPPAGAAKAKAKPGRRRRGAHSQPAPPAHPPPGAVYDGATGELLCRRLAEGESLQRICRLDGMPSRLIVRQWLDTEPEFAVLYAKARRHQADSLIDTAIDTAHETLAHDNAASVRVKIDALMKLAAQLSARLHEAATGAGESAPEFSLGEAILAARARLNRLRDS